jgi:FlaA1/EpsC-like NDP-sugar epimerase
VEEWNVINPMDKAYLMINTGFFIASILFVVYASLNELWMFALVIPLQAIHLIFSLRSHYQDLNRYYQEYSPSFMMTALNIVVNLFVYTIFFGAFLFYPMNAISNLILFFVAIIVMMSITSSSLVGEGLGQIMYERQNKPT